MARESAWSAAMKGGLAGLIGVAVLTAAMKAGSILLLRGGLLPEEPAPASDDPNVQPPGRLAGKVGDAVGTDLDRRAQLAAAQGIHWTYGTGWGVVYGLVQNHRRWPPLAGGAGLGLVTSMVASTIVPALGLSRPPFRQPGSVSAFMMGLHLIYGWVIALAYERLSRLG